MPAKALGFGPTGEAVARNIEHCRVALDLSYAELSRLLTEYGCPISPLGLTRIRDLRRRVDVDDLAALASVLGVSAHLLLSQGPVVVVRVKRVS
jgi:hypothetical protein